MNYAYCVCYDSLYVFKNKDLAKNYFKECYLSSEGAEKERYRYILIDLMFCDIGTDNITQSINEIICFDDNNKIVEKIQTNWQHYKVAIQEMEDE